MGLGEPTTYHDGQWVDLSDAARVLGVARITLRQRIVSGELEAFSDPLDRRRRLIRRRDLLRFAKPRREEQPIAAA